VQQEYRLCSRIGKGEVKQALRKTNLGKAVGTNCIPVKIWTCLGDQGPEWLIEHFNVIFRNAKMLCKWRTSTIITLYKNKGDI